MRWGLIAWCVVGISILGLKVHLDRTAAKYPDVAVRAGDVVYFIPRYLMTNEQTWRADLSRLSGCWDAREAGVVSLPSSVAGCHQPRALHLDFTRLPGDSDLLRRYAVNAAFWMQYGPPSAQLDDLIASWGRAPVSYRSDWQLFRLELAGTPWVYLFLREPKSQADIAGTFAGRCFRPDVGTDLGMSCSYVERLEGGLALEFSFGPDAVPDFANVRNRALMLLETWKRPAT